MNFSKSALSTWQELHLGVLPLLDTKSVADPGGGGGGGGAQRSGGYREGVPGVGTPPPPPLSRT